MAEEVIPNDLDITDELIAERRAEEPGQTPEDMTPWQTADHGFHRCAEPLGRPDYVPSADTSHDCDGL